MKTLLGMTYVQMNTLSDEELIEILVKYTAEKIRTNMLLNIKNEAFINVYCEKATPKLRKIYSEFFTKEMLDFQRLIYDTEEKFNLGSDMETSVAGISVVVGDMTGELMQEMMEERRH